MKLVQDLMDIGHYRPALQKSSSIGGGVGGDQLCLESVNHWKISRTQFQGKTNLIKTKETQNIHVK